MIVGVDIGGQHVSAAVVDAAHRVVEGSYTRRAADPGADRQALIAAWSSAIGAAMERVGPASVAGIGIAMPGPFDCRTGVGHFAGNAKFEALYGVDVGAALGAALRQPRPIRFLNDATAFSVGAVAAAVASPPRRAVGVTLGTGLGSAFLDGGVPVIEGNDVALHGCLWHLPYRDGIADDYVSTRWILGEARRRLGRPFDEVKPVADAARAGQEEAAAILTDYGAHLAAVLVPWLARFEADLLIFGGRISGAYDLFKAPLTRALAALDRTPAIVIRTNTEEAAIVGAAMTFTPAFWNVARHRLSER